MLSYLDHAIIRSKMWFENLKDEFLADERGVSGIVAAIILLLIAVVLAAVFWEKINTMVQGWWNTIDSSSQKLPTGP